jgi:hypothetical protein
MDTYSYELLVKEPESGATIKVVNEDTNVIGDVKIFNHGYFNVHVGHGEEVWASEKCRTFRPDEEWKFLKDHH